MFGDWRGILDLWREELRAGLAGRRHLARRVLVVGALQAAGLRLLGHLVPGFEVADWRSAGLAVVTVALLNAGLWPVLVSLTLPLAVLTFGTFTLVLNAGLLLLTAALVPGVQVAGFGAALGVGLGLAAINALVSTVLEVGEDEAFYRHVVGRAARRRRPVAADTRGRGLLVVQLDGLGVDVLRFAMRSGLMPTLARWVRTGSHRLLGWDCGLPSQTSASQAGLLYGDNFDIPAFRWYEKETGRLRVSNHPADAAEIERRLAARGDGLLEPAGASVSTLFTGGAERAVLTVSTGGARDGRRQIRSSDFRPYFLDPYVVSRSLALMLWEVLLELWQAHRQRVREVQPRVGRGGAFPLLRAISCVLLRDLTTAVVVDELYRGVPVVYADFVGYDELAHHAGPEAPETLAVLGGLDRQLAALEQATLGAPRPYDVVVLSDHGQSSGAPFRQQYGLTLEGLVRSLTHPAAGVCVSAGTHEGWGRLNALLVALVGVPARLAARLRGWQSGRLLQTVRVELGPERSAPQPAPSDVVLCASGNLGLVYFTEQSGRLSREAIETMHPGLVQGLATHPGVGFVLVHSEANGPLALGRDGVRHLADDRVEGRDPLAGFGPYAAGHLRRLASFPHVGDLVVNSRIEPGTSEVAAFEELVGSHGGLGGPQTAPFLLVPASWPVDGENLVGAPAVHAILRRGWADSAAAHGVQDTTSAPWGDAGGVLPGEEAGRSRSPVSAPWACWRSPPAASPACPPPCGRGWSGSGRTCRVGQG